MKTSWIELSVPEVEDVELHSFYQRPKYMSSLTSRCYTSQSSSTNTGNLLQCLSPPVRRSSHHRFSSTSLSTNSKQHQVVSKTFEESFKHVLPNHQARSFAGSTGANDCTTDRDPSAGSKPDAEADRPRILRTAWPFGRITGRPDLTERRSSYFLSSRATRHGLFGSTRSVFDRNAVAHEDQHHLNPAPSRSRQNEAPVLFSILTEYTRLRNSIKIIGGHQKKDGRPNHIGLHKLPPQSQYVLRQKGFDECDLSQWAEIRCLERSEESMSRLLDLWKSREAPHQFQLPVPTFLILECLSRNHHNIVSLRLAIEVVKLALRHRDHGSMSKAKHIFNSADEANDESQTRRTCEPQLLNDTSLFLRSLGHLIRIARAVRPATLVDIADVATHSNLLWSQENLTADQASSLSWLFNQLLCLFRHPFN